MNSTIETTTPLIPSTTTTNIEKKDSNFLNKIKKIFNLIYKEVFRSGVGGKSKNYFLFFFCLLFIGIFQIIIFGTIYSHSLIIIFGGLHLIQISISYLISGIQLYFINQSNNNIFEFKTFSFGFSERFEILFRFSNIIFLWFISFSMIIESFHHLIDPHSLNLNNLWLISFLNCFLILFGFYFFKLKSNFDFNLLNNISKNVQNQKLFFDLFRDCLTQISILFSIILSSL